MDVSSHRPVKVLSLLSKQRGKAFFPTLCGFILLFSTAPMLQGEEEPPADSIPTATAVAEDPSSYKKMSLEELMNQEVTSVSKRSEPYAQAPAAIQVITQDEIRRSGASSLPEALRLADNLNVAQKNSHDWGISARGFNTDLANKLLVLIDGRTVYSPLDAGVFWNLQNVLLEDIDRIEVVSGPGGTLWGANAVNGVINVTTKSAKETQGTYLETGGGTDLRDFGGVRYGGKLAPDVYYRVYGMHFDRNNEVYDNGNPAPDSWDNSQGGFRIDAEPSEDNTFTVQGDYYNGGTEQPSNRHQQFYGGNLVTRWNHAISEDSDLSVQFYYDRTHFTLPVAPVLLSPAGTFIDTLDTYDATLQHSFQAGDYNRIVWGVGYRFTHDEVENAPGLAFYPTTLEQNLPSAFIQDEIMLRENLFLTVGTKFEHNDYTGVEVEPSSRIRWDITDKQMVWAAISRAVRMPSRIDRDLTQPTGLAAPLPPSVLNGGADFKSETVIAYELGYRAQISPTVSTTVSTFYNQYDNLRSTTPSPPPAFLGFPLTIQNNIKGETYGVELGLTYQAYEWWRLHGGYNYLEEHLQVKSMQVDFSNGLNETSDPQHQFSLRSSMDLAHNVEFDTGLRWVDVLHNNNGPTRGNVPGYVELDVRLGWRPVENLELSIVGQNLLHDQHAEYGFPSPTRTEIERSVYGKITWRF